MFSLAAICVLVVCVNPYIQVAHAATTPVKTETTEALAWTELTNTGDSAGIKETGSIDVSDSYRSTLHIYVCLSEAQAHDGTEILVFTGSEAGVDGSWSLLTRFVCLSGKTAIKSDFANQEAVGQTVLGVTNPATGNLDHDGKRIFLEDTATPSQSEIAYQIDNSGDAGDTITIIGGGLDHQKETTSDVWTVDGAGQDNSAVYSTNVAVPDSASQVNVIINNWYDETGSDVYGMVRVTKFTDLN